MEKDATAGALVAGIAKNLCPRCFEGKVFRGLFKIGDECPVCQLSFQRDYTGARWLSYYVVLFTVLPVFLGLMLLRAGLPFTLGASLLMLLIATPLAVRLVTLISLYLEVKR